MTATLDEHLQDSMHHGEDKVPVYGCPVDILQLNRGTWRAI
jgi:hypothetical protein